MAVNMITADAAMPVMSTAALTLSPLTRQRYR